MVLRSEHTPDPIPSPLEIPFEILIHRQSGRSSVLQHFPYTLPIFSLCSLFFDFSDLSSSSLIACSISGVTPWCVATCSNPPFSLWPMTNSWVLWLICTSSRVTTTSSPNILAISSSGIPLVSGRFLIMLEFNVAYIITQ